MSEFLPRVLQLEPLLEKKSFFLFGPRSTGKSSLIREQISKKNPIFNLLRHDLYMALSTRPEELEGLIRHQLWPPKLVVIDEIQRIPELLNEVHRLIEEYKITFLLTGSSARKLKREGVNLLAGRAWKTELFPLSWPEIPDFELSRYLLYGGLPSVYLSQYPEEELHAYVSTYLKEEIQAEALVRKIPAFSRFLEASALTSGQIINFSAVSSDTGVPISTVREYYHILEDTFIGFLVPAWTKSIKRKATSTAKFYYFDIGVKNTLAQIRTLPEKTDLFGQAFEHFIALEIRAYLSYRRERLKLSYWKTKSGIEVDFIIGDTTAIEVKASQHISDKHLKGLKVLKEEGICSRYVLVSQDPLERKHEGIDILYWKHFLKTLWEDKLIVS